jgi:hypothetical protein
MPWGRPRSQAEHAGGPAPGSKVPPCMVRQH